MFFWSFVFCWVMMEAKMLIGRERSCCVREELLNPGKHRISASCRDGLPGQCLCRQHQ